MRPATRSLGISGWGGRTVRSKGLGTSCPDVNERNRDEFNLPTEVAKYAEYAECQGLTWCEQRLVERYVSRHTAVLDVGVGTGRTTAVLRASALKYVGVDYAERMIERCRELYPGTELYVEDAADLSRFHSGSFDLIFFSFNGIDYLSDNSRGAFLRESNRVLREGGKLIFSAHNPRCLFQLSSPSAPPGVGVRLGTRAIFGYVIRNFLRKARVMKTRAFWVGEGYVDEPPLTLHMASRRRVYRELSRFGFTAVEIVSCTFPRHSISLTTTWYYYVCTKPSTPPV